MKELEQLASELVDAWAVAWEYLRNPTGNQGGKQTHHEAEVGTNGVILGAYGLRSSNQDQGGTFGAQKVLDEGSVALGQLSSKGNQGRRQTAYEEAVSIIGMHADGHDRKISMEGLLCSTE